MNKKEIHAEVNRRLAQGDSKTVTFKALRGRVFATRCWRT